MVRVFTISRGYTVYMGKDKFENELLIKYALPEDIWFHVENLSSAHVYLRLKPEDNFKNIALDLLKDCVQLVKYNSIKGSKQQKVSIIYTPASNLLKKKGMQAGEVAYKNYNLQKRIKNVQKDSEILRRIKKTETEMSVDVLKKEKESKAQEIKTEAKLKELKAQKEKEEEEKRKNEEKEKKEKYEKEMEKYKVSNQEMDMTFEEFEDDFM
ncbi:duf814-related protein [Anaeramoeba ignava]|uniref:Duf814-related protein n=1 Tax=Anaeramoeba ignava TaxID=1746090 RepID=A0A9Q0LE57_ANAIG|nr:duf814-related protein [Anaeramoeba ignava]